MKILGFEKELSTGIKLLDDQNKLIFVLLNKLMKMYFISDLNPEYHKIYSTLMVYAQKYFNNEEKLMQQIGFPQFSFHKNQHQEFIKTIQLFNDQYLNGDNVLADFQRYIQKWFDGHIKISDRKLAPYLKKYEDLI